MCLPTGDHACTEPTVLLETGALRYAMCSPHSIYELSIMNNIYNLFIGMGVVQLYRKAKLDCAPPVYTALPALCRQPTLSKSSSSVDVYSSRDFPTDDTESIFQKLPRAHDHERAHWHDACSKPLSANTQVNTLASCANPPLHASCITLLNFTRNGLFDHTVYRPPISEPCACTTSVLALLHRWGICQRNKCTKQ
jgi:hypothetical protein